LHDVCFVISIIGFSFEFSKNTANKVMFLFYLEYAGITSLKDRKYFSKLLASIRYDIIVNSF